MNAQGSPARAILKNLDTLRRRHQMRPHASPPPCEGARVPFPPNPPTPPFTSLATDDDWEQPGRASILMTCDLPQHGA